MAKREIAVGDWVRWLHGAHGVVIARVEYVREKQRYPFGLECVTTLGCVPVRDVLECRPSGADATEVAK